MFASSTSRSVIAVLYLSGKPEVGFRRHRPDSFDRGNRYPVLFMLFSLSLILLSGLYVIKINFDLLCAAEQSTVVRYIYIFPS